MKRGFFFMQKKIKPRQKLKKNFFFLQTPVVVMQKKIKLTRSISLMDCDRNENIANHKSAGWRGI